MKNSINIILLFLMIISKFTCAPSKKADPEPTKYTYNFIVSSPQIDYNFRSNYKGFEGAKIDIFDTETDYLTNQKIVKSIYTTISGIASYTSTKKEIWFKISKDTLNNLRSGYITKASPTWPGDARYLGGSAGNYGGVDNNIIEIMVMLSTTPIKLQLRCFKAGQPLGNKKVRLFLSNEELVSRDNFNYSSKDTRFKAYGGFYDISAFLETETDSQGYANFFALEPRRIYWFTIDNKVPTPSSTINKLTDNPDLQNSFEISIP